MKRIGWAIVNMFQVFFFVFWSILWQSVAIVLRIVLWNERIPLIMARRVWAPGIAWVVGCRITSDGHENVDFEQPHIFVCNHQSTADIGVAFIAIPTPLRFVAKSQLKHVPFLGWYMRLCGMIFVNRAKSEKAVASMKRASEKIRSGASVLAFPEGTRSSDGVILPFKKGIFVVAIESGVPVVPIAIEGSRQTWPKNTFRFRPSDVYFRIGEPIPTADLTYDDRDVLKEQVRAAVIDLHDAVAIEREQALQPSASMSTA